MSHKNKNQLLVSVLINQFLIKFNTQQPNLRPAAIDHYYNHSKKFLAGTKQVNNCTASTMKKLLYNQITVDIDNSSVGAYKRKTSLSLINRQYQEKKKLSLFYGSLPQKQIDLLVNKAHHSHKKFTFSALQHFISLLEGRADVVLFRSGFAPNIYAAKNCVNHGLITVNGKRITKSNLILKSGDVLRVSSSIYRKMIHFLSVNRRQRKIYLKKKNFPNRFINLKLFSSPKS